jgi:aminopeptidase N
VDDFVAGGMENTSATTLTDTTLFTAATENIRSSEGLVAHELAHQWFGDLVTCKDWSHIWLNEGFATYYETLYRERKRGRDDMLYELYERVRDITGRPNDTNAIVRRTYNDPGELFSYLAYPKGGWVLHMLRSQLGPELYRHCIKTYLERHQYGSVVTEDLRAVVEELSGRSFDQFFDQWLYHAHHPELEINYAWDAKTRLAKVTVKQVQRISDDVLLFNFPLSVRFKTKSATVDKQVTVKEKSEDFYFALEDAPTIVRIDPEYTLLARTTFNPPPAMLHAQLADKTDMVGRLLAIEALNKNQDKDSVAKLKQALNRDGFYGVRIEAARALRAIHIEEALDALLASTNQPDARVRREVFRAIGGFYDPKVFAVQSAMVAREKNPDIQTEGIRELGTYSKNEVRETLLRYLSSQSYRNGLAEAAVNAIRAQDDPAYLEPLEQNLKERQADYTGRGFARGLDTLAYLARTEPRKDAVREFLAGYVNHPRRTVQLGAIGALGTLQDARAIPVLERFAQARKRLPERIAAENALKKIEDARKPMEGLSDLRREFLELDRENRKLRHDFEALEKKVNAAAPKGQAPETQSRKTSPRLKSPKEKSGR